MDCDNSQKTKVQGCPKTPYENTFVLIEFEVLSLARAIILDRQITRSFEGNLVS